MRRPTLLSRAEAGASSVEYGMLVAAIAAVLVVILFVLGGQVRDLFDHTCDSVGSKVTGSTC